MADIEDNRGTLGREESGGSAAKQNATRQDSDRDYGARDTKGDQTDGVTPSPDADTPSQYSGMGGSRTDQLQGHKPGEQAAPGNPDSQA